jgi:mgtE-like transporter
MAFSPRRRARGVRDFLRAERRTLRQGLAALVLGTFAAFVAGVALGSITGTLERLPGLIILIPAVLSMRGTIFGSMGARLGTAIHAGTFEVTRDRGGVLSQNVFVAMVLTLTAALYLAVLARASALAFGLPSIPLLDLVTIAVVGGIVDSTFILLLTRLLSVLSYRRGWDLDAVSTPLITAVADMITVPVIFLVSFIVRFHALSTGLGVASVLIALYAGFRGITTDLRLARRILLEMTLVVVLTPVLDILAGTVVQSRLDRFIAFPGLLVLVPPFVAGAGSLGGILCSRLSSKLHLGVVSTRAIPDRSAYPDAGLIFAFSVIVFTMTGALGLAFSVVAGKPYPGATTMVMGTLVAGLLATVLTIFASYYIAVMTARFGLDPDNHSVPAITSVMDLAGVLVFLLVIGWFGVAVHG